jgi:hypothetical protein
MNSSSGLNYLPQNVADNVLTTWWSPKTQSTQEWIRIDFGSVINIEGIEIHAGSHYPNFQNLGNLYPLNSRITQATLEFSDGSTENVTFADIDEIQRVGFPIRQTSFIKLYPKTWQTGNKWKDLCISHFAGLASNEKQ